MNHLNNKIKLMDLGLKEEFLVHVIFASFLKEFDTFVVNNNIQPKKWNLERCMAMCVQEEEKIRQPMVALSTMLETTKECQYQC